MKPGHVIVLVNEFAKQLLQVTSLPPGFIPLS
jgi:hypothetical protein